ncbi:MAG: peptidylprolyl isomerase [Betaproteobacteria bacterium]
MHRAAPFHVLVLCLLVRGAPLHAAPAPELPADVLVKSPWMVLTRADYAAAVANVPENLRFEFSASPKRVQGILNNLLVTKTLAAQARAHGTRPAQPFESGGGDPSERALATAELERVDADAGKTFDAEVAAFELKAREEYAISRDRYTVPAEVRISDIAVAIKDRGDAAALARAREARQRIVEGADFAAIAREYSDDPTTRDKGGALPFVNEKAMAPAYAKGVFALDKVGAVSEPIRAPAAYHVVRLDERKPQRRKTFDEARAAIMQELRSRYIAEQREARIQSIHADPALQINQPAIDALVNRIDPQRMKPLPRAASADATVK